MSLHHYLLEFPIIHEKCFEGVYHKVSKIYLLRSKIKLHNLKVKYCLVYAPQGKQIDNLTEPQQMVKIDNIKEAFYMDAEILSAINSLRLMKNSNYIKFKWSTNFTKNYRKKTPFH